MYTRKRYVTRQGILVEEYHSPRYMAPGEERRPRKKVTPEQVRKNNQREKEKRIRILLMENFSPMDYHTVLTYRKDERPSDYRECKGHLQNLLRKLRDRYRKTGAELKWVANIEVGSRGAWHIHLILNRIEGIDVMMAKLWPYGRPRHVLIEDAEGISRLASYISKKSETLDEEEIKGFSRSRNLKMPKAQKKHFRRWKTWNREKVRIPKGYYLDKNSVEEWIDCMGYPHREYTLFRLESKGG